MIFANTMKVSLPQRFHKLYDTKANSKIILDEIKKTKADLLIFPEVFLSGYLCRDKLFDVAEPFNGKLVKKIVQAVKKKKCHLIFGMPERDEEVKGHIYNTAVYRCDHLLRSILPRACQSLCTPGRRHNIMYLSVAVCHSPVLREDNGGPRDRKYDLCFIF
jgi:hypothetical protein